MTIIPCVPKWDLDQPAHLTVQSLPSLFIDIFYNIQIFCKCTNKALIRLHKCTGWSFYTHMRKRPFSSVEIDMGHTKWKCVFRNIQTVKSHICTVSSGPSLAVYTITGYHRMYDWSVKAWMTLRACAGWPKSAHFAHVRRHYFSCHSLYNFCQRISVLF